ncbi:PepSY-associated TM helix domain-containing protein [Neptunicella sp. SCSIO 80796]|uniref:PepSY-associated TM helix domain-containing protein n=1 Tax=Neptunicella plasticusilytica TaxID=3117012 RepID=UPI003A4E1616
MNFTPSPALNKQSLSGHAWLGLLTGALMYLVCLSGALAVYYPEFERWEQPDVAEFTHIEVSNVQKAYENVLNQNVGETEHLFLLLPSEEMPRATISSDTRGWFINQDGSLAGSKSHPWKDMLVNLHLYLHLPFSFGMIVVSILGALLCGLIISGFMAHRPIFKDAFSLRFKGQYQLTQADIHNRLSVWAAPFHLMIGVTGAYFGLAALFGLLFSQAFYNGDQDALMADVFGAEPALQQPVQPAAIDKALLQLGQIAPQATPFYITLEDVGTPKQYMIIGARHPQRLIYAEQYRFDSAGNYIDNAGFSDGDAGKQAIFSVYRLHFGHFGGPAVKVLYLLLGLALTVISVSGVNIWLAKRKGRDFLNNAWTGIVWGTPLGLILSALVKLVTGFSPVAIFWTTVVFAIAFAHWLNDDKRGARYLQKASAIALILLLLVYYIVFQQAGFNSAALMINSALLVTALILLWIAKPKVTDHMTRGS